MSAELPHSRACGFRRHDHGPECHTNCPTCHGRALPDTPTAPEPAAAPFCTRCDGYGVVLPVGSSIVVTCPACNGKTADRPERGPNTPSRITRWIDGDDPHA